MFDSRVVLPWRFKALNRAAELLRWHELPAADLREEVLRAEASKETGLSDFGDRYYEEGLSRLIESAERDADLTFIGRCGLHSVIARFLSNRLQLTEARKKTPELFERRLLPPIVVLGLPRSGTTFLHRMLALDPANRGIPLWELMRPVSGESREARMKRAEEESRSRAKLLPNFDKIHFTRFDSLEECVFLFGPTFVSFMFFLCAPVYSYLEWIKSQDLLKPYQDYRLFLQLLQAVDPSRRLTLKQPAHAATLDKLIAVEPDALIVQTHRHPVPVCSSFNSIIHELHNISTKRHQIARFAKAQADWIEYIISSNLEFRENHPGVIYDVHYDRLVRDPVNTVRDVYRHYRLDWSGAFERRLEAYVRENPEGKHGKHRHTGRHFGNDSEMIAKRFTSYIEKFGLSYSRQRSA